MLALVGVLVAVLAPTAALAVLPLLLVAACPLAMLLMGGMMMGGRHDSGQPAALASSPGKADEIASLRAQVEELMAKIENGTEADDSSSLSRQS